MATDSLLLRVGLGCLCVLLTWTILAFLKRRSFSRLFSNFLRQPNEGKSGGSQDPDGTVAGDSDGGPSGGKNSSREKEDKCSPSGGRNRQGTWAASVPSLQLPGRVALEDKFVRNGDVEIHYVEAGPRDGHLVVLLHGFPSFWYEWKYQIGPLAEAGFHVVAPDMRGYNLSSRPQGVKAYGLGAMMSDVNAVMDDCAGRDATCTLVGHDWGGAVAWIFAQAHPERLERLIVLSMAYPQLYKSAMFTDLGQMRRLAYVYVFLLPWLPEFLLAIDNCSAIQTITKIDPGRKDAEEHVKLHVQAQSTQEARTAAVNWYRAIPWHWPLDFNARVDMPVMAFWGELDDLLQPYLVDPPRELVPNARVIRLPNAGHWPMWDEPECVTKHMIDFIKGESNTDH